VQTSETIRKQEGPASREEGQAKNLEREFDDAISDDLNTAKALTILETVMSGRALIGWDERIQLITTIDSVLGLKLATITRRELRKRPTEAKITEPEIGIRLAARDEAREQKDFARSDMIRDELSALGVDVMDGDPMRWDWGINLS
jgi:cysteinyl-tRNA synthetase